MEKTRDKVTNKMIVRFISDSPNSSRTIYKKDNGEYWIENNSFWLSKHYKIANNYKEYVEYMSLKGL